MYHARRACLRPPVLFWSFHRSSGLSQFKIVIEKKPISTLHLGTKVLNQIKRD